MVRTHLIKTKKDSFSEMEVRKTFENLQIPESEKDRYDKGTVPGSFVSENGKLRFQFARKTRKEEEGLVDTQTRTGWEKYGITFLDSGYISIEKGSRKAHSKEMIDMIQEHFVGDYIVEVLEIREEMVRNAISNSQALHQIKVTPTRATEPDWVQAHDRADLSRREFDRRYGDDPVKKAKMSLPNTSVTKKIGFDVEKNLIAVHGRDIPTKKEMEMIDQLVQEITPVVGEDIFQEQISSVL